MAEINSRTLFLTTSPRTPEKMIPEIELLIKHFAGQKWNKKTQNAFMEKLRKEQFFNGEGANDPSFSARDRINRAPKSLGFVVLSPKLKITPAGEVLISSRRKDEVFLRQMLKFQVPSPYHKPTHKAACFCVRPYLEILRLVRTLGTLRFDELQMFGMQLTDWHDFDDIANKIETFRKAKAENNGNYHKFKVEYLNNELKEIYSERIASGETNTRESTDKTIAKFLRTQSRNLRDYADACFRYLRATGLVNVSHVGKSLSIVPERIDDVEYILQTVSRDPCLVTDEKQYVEYLGDSRVPPLLTDNKKELTKRIHKEFPSVQFNEDDDVEALKNLLSDLIEGRKAETLRKQIAEIKDYKLYNDIQKTFEQIIDGELYDAPLMLEWNTWRAMTMLDGGDIKANLNFDDFGNPLSTAQGNMADIVCDYGDFLLAVEVTMACGQRQYEMEGEPVSRHLGKMKANNCKPCYSLFVAPTINDACVAHFYTLLSTNVRYYGGKSVIIPLPLDIFQKMLEDSYKATYTPKPTQVRRFFEHSSELAKNCKDEVEWYAKVKKIAIRWLG